MELFVIALIICQVYFIYSMLSFPADLCIELEKIDELRNNIKLKYFAFLCLFLQLLLICFLIFNVPDIFLSIIVAILSVRFANLYFKHK